METAEPRLEHLGPYQILDEIGRGNMGVVYRAYQPALDRTVAIKVLPARLATDPTFVERFRREAKAVARLSHPNIPVVYDSGELEGSTYIVTQFIDGFTLREKLGVPVPWDTTVSVVEALASALDHAHAHGVVHRDVKPANTIIDTAGKPFLTDFGLARILESGLRLTRAGTVLGTPSYMSPEQGAGNEAGPQADQYSLAVIAYQMLTGTLPFTGSSPTAVMIAHIESPVPAASSRNRLLVPAVDAVLARALAKRPEERYPSCAAFAAALAGRPF
jgi:eukaryotic-like serine/threonine-protein kinase